MSKFLHQLQEKTKPSSHHLRIRDPTCEYGGMGIRRNECERVGMGNGGMGIRRNECERVGMGNGDMMEGVQGSWYGNEIHVNGTDALVVHSFVHVHCT